jgi:hypothetical protein
MLLATSILQPSAPVNEDNLYLPQKKVFNTTPSVTEKLEEQPLEA